MKHWPIFLLIVQFISCRKDCINENPNDYRLYRAEYYDPTGAPLGGFKNLSYTGSFITKIDMMSLNRQELAYQNNNLVLLKNMLGNVQFPITSYELKYSVSNQLENIILNSNDINGQSEGKDTISFTWVGSRLKQANSIGYNQGIVKRREKVSYSYTGDNITKCVMEGTYHGFTAGPLNWKDSVEFFYDAMPNKFSDIGLSFFLDEFRFILFSTRIRSLNMRDDVMYAYFDPAFLPFINSKNNVVEMRSLGNALSRFSFYTGTGVLANKLTEIKVNDRLVSKYFYRKM